MTIVIIIIITMDDKNSNTEIVKQNVWKSGTSYVITIKSDVMKKLNLKDGDTIIGKIKKAEIDYSDL